METVLQRFLRYVSFDTMSDAARDKKSSGFAFAKIEKESSDCFAAKNTSHGPRKDILDKDGLINKNGKSY